MRSISYPALYHVLRLEMAAWSREETYKLIEIWSNDKIQAQLEGCKGNQDIFAKFLQSYQKKGMSALLSSAGIK